MPSRAVCQASVAIAAARVVAAELARAASASLSMVIPFRTHTRSWVMRCQGTFSTTRGCQVIRIRLIPSAAGPGAGFPDLHSSCSAAAAPAASNPRVSWDTGSGSSPLGHESNPPLSRHTERARGHNFAGLSGISRTTLRQARDKGEVMTATAPFRAGGWLPSDQAFLHQWVGDLAAQVEAEGDKPLLPVVDEFRRLIEEDPEVYMLFRFMLEQVPYHESPAHEPEVKTVEKMLRLFNHVLTRAPDYNDTGLVGCPINAILDWAMGTQAGFAAFLNDRVNEQLKKLLNEWGVFLKSADSTAVLNDT